jgi:hypothetical protein
MGKKEKERLIEGEGYIYIYWERVKKDRLTNRKERKIEGER